MAGGLQACRPRLMRAFQCVGEQVAAGEMATNQVELAGCRHAPPQLGILGRPLMGSRYLAPSAVCSAPAFGWSDAGIVSQAPDALLSEGGLPPGIEVAASRPCLKSEVPPGRRWHSFRLPTACRREVPP